ncbi:ATPase, T2SS/T4P/T4SS family [Kiloniella laminariae]|uniref:ATPase, T2SS/T4P/T4SS family n=1 Tax=Kiloniella laminariae TaxID=454162 RepID=A0ABT4LPL4_9PROT|nr:ATPase, T2SS/T4P/T4SS family [Kiloniella laminariae]MCZ4283072.1 ATPase, T2SS/T4P/T4SS family [Kiloniella laminariae]
MLETSQLISIYSRPIQQYLNDPSVTEICINRFDDIWIEQNGSLRKTKSSFETEINLNTFVTQIASNLNQSLDVSEHPILDARLEDGTRINAVLDSISLFGTCVSIRPFPKKLYTISDLVELGSLTPRMLDVLEVSIQNHLNIVVSGGTGSGKTTILRALSSFIDKGERVVTVEDTCEHLLDKHPHVISLEAPKRNGRENRLVVSMGTLIKNTLRMRPDRIIVGEIRDAEAASAFLEAINTGHNGTLASIHANSSADMFWRLSWLFAASAQNFKPSEITAYIQNNIGLSIQVDRCREGKRRITEISWIDPERKIISLFKYVDADWKIDVVGVAEFLEFYG